MDVVVGRKARHLIERCPHSHQLPLFFLLPLLPLFPPLLPLLPPLRLRRFSSRIERLCAAVSVAIRARVLLARDHQVRPVHQPSPLEPAPHLPPPRPTSQYHALVRSVPRPSTVSTTP
eukprot:3653412-Rhodomonas_salina.1